MASATPNSNTSQILLNVKVPQQTLSYPIAFSFQPGGIQNAGDSLNYNQPLQSSDNSKQEDAAMPPPLPNNVLTNVSRDASQGEKPREKASNQQLPRNEKEHLFQEYNRLNDAYAEMEDAYNAFQTKKDHYLTLQDNYQNLGSTLNDMAYQQYAMNPNAQQQQGYPQVQGSPYQQQPQQMLNPYGSQYSAGLGQQAGPNPYQQQAQAQYSQMSPQQMMQQPLPGQGMPYYAPIPSQGGDQMASVYGQQAGQPYTQPPMPGGIPTQQSLQQYAQQNQQQVPGMGGGPQQAQGPSAPQQGGGGGSSDEDVKTLRKMLEMSPETAQIASQVSDDELKMLLDSDPRMQAAVKQMGPLIASGQVTPEMLGLGGGAGGAQSPEMQKPTDPAQAAKIAQGNPEMMQQAEQMLNQLPPEQQQAMFQKLMQDPEGQQILKQMGVQMPQQQQAQQKQGPQQAQQKPQAKPQG